MSIGRNRVPQQVVDAAVVQWANGKTLHRAVGGAGAQRFQPLVGFHIEIGKDEELDGALADLAVPQIEIKHQTQGGSARIVRHWSLGERIRFYPVTMGPPAPTVAGCLQQADATAESGLGVRWPQGERSRVAVRGYVHELHQAGYERIVQIGVKSLMGDRLLAALADHVRVCEAADEMVDRTKHPGVVDLYEVALPLVAGNEESFGKGDTAEVTPLRSGHPAEVTREHIRGHWRPDAVAEAALKDWPAVVAWAREYAVAAEQAQGAPARGGEETYEEPPF